MDLEITTEIRGEQSRLVWANGQFTGDEEFLGRVLRCAEGLRVDLTEADSLEVIRVCQEATPAPVHIVSLTANEHPVLDFTGRESDQLRDETFSAPA